MTLKSDSHSPTECPYKLQQMKALSSEYYRTREGGAGTWEVNKSKAWLYNTKVTSGITYFRHAEITLRRL